MDKKQNMKNKIELISCKNSNIYKVIFNNRIYTIEETIFNSEEKQYIVFNEDGRKVYFMPVINKILDFLEESKNIFRYRLNQEERKECIEKFIKKQDKQKEGN